MRCPTCNELLRLVLTQLEQHADIEARCPNNHEWKLRLRSEHLLPSTRQYMEAALKSNPAPSPAPVVASNLHNAKFTRAAWEDKYTAVGIALNAIRETKDEETLQWAARVIKRSMEEHVAIIVKAVQQGIISKEEAIELHSHAYPGIEKLL